MLPLLRLSAAALGDRSAPRVSAATVEQQTCSILSSVIKGFRWSLNFRLGFAVSASQVDGGLDADTVKEAAASGANVIVAGTAGDPRPRVFL